MHTSHLPYLDEHATVVAAAVDDVWRATLETLERDFSRAAAVALCRALGCAECTASGPRPLAEGSTLPGFRVLAATPRSELALAGQHRFSSYALTLRIDPAGAGAARVRAESRAAFPGLPGGAYRLLVIGTGGHVLAVRRLLSRIKTRAEAR